MKAEINKDPDNRLASLNGKTVEKIYQVDFNKDRHEDMYLPWLFFITFSDFDRFLEIEGDFDGDHIKISLIEISALDEKLSANNLSEEPDLWRVYETSKDEMCGKILGQKIRFIGYGISKDESETNNIYVRGEKDVFNFIRFNCENVCLTIFEGMGLAVSDDENVKLNFENTFERYSTK